MQTRTQLHRTRVHVKNTSIEKHKFRKQMCWGFFAVVVVVVFCITLMRKACFIISATDKMIRIIKI